MGSKGIKVRIKWKSVAVIIAVLVFAWVAYVLLTPDNLIKDNFFDKRRAAKAKSRFSSMDDFPLGDRQPWIWVHDFGLEARDEFGPSDIAIKMRFAKWATNLPLAYQSEFGASEDLFSRVKVWYLHYDAQRDPLEIGDDLDALIEGHSELTRGGVKITLAGVSQGGRVIHYYQQVSGGRKVGRVVTSGTAHSGVDLADPYQAEEACSQAYPFTGFLIFKLVDSEIDFNTPGMQSMLPGNPSLELAHRKSPLDQRWYLYGGVIEPDTEGLLDKAWTALNLADALLLKQSDALAADLACPVGAKIIEASGELGGSDGVVPLRSAHAEGLARGATVRTFSGYNHRNMLEGLDGETEFFEILVRDLVTFEP